VANSLTGHVVQNTFGAIRNLQLLLNSQVIRVNYPPNLFLFHQKFVQMAEMELFDSG
jgi:hypothetical protein